jgi:hypothetical protein
MKKKRCAECLRRFEAQIEAVESELTRALDGEKYQREQVELWHEEFQKMCEVRDRVYARIDESERTISGLRMDLAYDEGVMARQRERLIALMELVECANSLHYSAILVNINHRTSYDVAGQYWIRGGDDWRRLMDQARDLTKKILAFKVDHMMGIEQRRGAGGKGGDR